MKCITINALFELVALIQKDIAAEQIEIEGPGESASMYMPSGADLEITTVQ